MAGKVSIGCTIFILLLAASIADARLWPWPEDFAEVKARRLGDRFITEEEGDSLVKQDLCFDCHDGSVLDNRELWDPGLHGHRVDIVPKQALPQGIPLFEGRLYCGSCHLPHGDLPGARTEVKKPYLRYENTNDIFCVACHQERATPGPQEASRNHSFLKKARTDTATADPEAWQRIQGLGGRVGKEGATRCQSCHRPHGGPSRSALITSVDKSQLCSICHHDIKDSSTTVNHPLHQENPWKVENRPLTVECLTCHRVHEAPVPGILLAEQGEGLCLHCHAKNKLPANDIHREERFTKQARAFFGNERRRELRCMPHTAPRPGQVSGRRGGWGFRTRSGFPFLRRLSRTREGTGRESNRSLLPLSRAMAQGDVQRRDPPACGDVAASDLHRRGSGSRGKESGHERGVPDVPFHARPSGGTVRQPSSEEPAANRCGRRPLSGMPQGPTDDPGNDPQSPSY